MFVQVFVIILLLNFSICISISTNSSDILYDIYPFIRVYNNGTIQRFIGTGFVPASIDPTTGVQSEDVIIAPETNVTARIYLPKNVNPGHKVPLLVYFHGGGFFTESAFSPTYHKFMNSLVAKANVVGVSINYRLAPENPLPIGYEDSWLALKWVLGQSSNAWLTKYVDFDRVYLGGDSAGGNIAHNMAIRVGSNKTDSIVIKGMFLNCPHFWGNKRIGREGRANKKIEAIIESIWIHAYPNSTGFDDPLSNPGKDPRLSELGGKRVLVYVAELDALRDRGLYYGTVLKKSKWDGIVKVVDVKGEDHVFSIRFPDKPNSKIMLTQLAYFLNEV